MKRTLMGLGLGMFVLTSSLAFAEQPMPAKSDNQQQDHNNKPVAQVQMQQPVKLPTYHFLRNEEDWSVLKNATSEQKASDVWNQFKYIPLNESGDNWLSLGASARVRVEDWHNYNFVDDHGNSYLWRLFIHGDLHLSRYFRAFLQGISATAVKRDLPDGRRTTDTNQADFQQAFVDVNIPISKDMKLVIRPGRQMLSYGAQRLISPSPWSNAPRTFDGAKAILKMPNFKASAFFTYLVNTKKYRLDTTNHNVNLSGLYTTTDLDSIDMMVDAYWLYLRKDNSAFDRTSATDHRHTFGLRLYGAYNEKFIHYDLGFAYQLGEYGSRDIRAYMWYVLFSHEFDELKIKPKLSIGYSIATGGSSTAKKMRTFNQLFPTVHEYLGYLDLFARQNIEDLHFGLETNPWDTLHIGAKYHLFKREDRKDGVYNTDGTVLRAGNLTSGREIGRELDTYANYKLDRHFSTLLGYSHFYPRTFMRNSGTSEPINFVYFSVQYVI